MKTTEELMFGDENNERVHQAIDAAIARADAAGLPPAYEPYFSMSKTMPVDEVLKLRRRHMVDQVNANQRLEGYEPDEQLDQLQEQFIAGQLTTTEMIEILTDYAQKIRKGQELERKLTPEQRKLFEAIDGATSDAAFEGATIDPVKIATWKKHVLAGMEADELFQIIRDDKEKIITVRPKPEYHDSPGMKHMGNGYFISSDEPADPPVK
jgi:hypothetical protein